MIFAINFRYRQCNNCFRLLNSEIGNDQKRKEVLIMKMVLGFRLLNSEIGNDRIATVL